MAGRLLSAAPRVLLTVLLTVFCVVSAFAQDDPDPNSPTPILLTSPDSTRALASVAPVRGKGSLERIANNRAFDAGSKMALYFTNVSLMPGEGANAFRVYASDSQGHFYRYPVVALGRVAGYPDVYRATVILIDDMKFWDAPRPGDLNVYLTWRGLASNVVKLGVGGLEPIKDVPGTFPTPLATARAIAATEAKQEKTDSYGGVGYRWSSDRMRFLEQATFGPTQSLDARIRRIGLRTWLAEQFEDNYADIPYPDIPLMPSNQPSTCDGSGGDDVPATCRRDRYTQYPVQIWFFKNALYGESQLRHRVNWALNQLWVISGSDTQQSSHMIAYQNAINRNVFGNWRQLMYDVTLNAGMGNYLDMIRSTRTNPNENYPREIMQLFNIGLFMLNQDGTLQLDGQGNPIPTYDQTTVTNLTKVFTGWRDCRTTDYQASCPNAVPGSPDYKDSMSLNTNNHDLTAKTLLTYPGSESTQNIPACGPPTCTTQAAIYPYAYASLNQALDNLYNHPNVAPFVSKYLIQHLVTGDPSPAYVGRISAVFNANRTNPTQMKEVIKAILLDPEARGDSKTDPNYGKLREPVQLTTNLYRQLGVTSADGTTQSDGNISRYPRAMSQNPFYSPTVFNFYPPGYVIPGTSILGPEFAIFNTGSSIARANFVNSAVYGRINVSQPDTPNGTQLYLADLEALSNADPTGNRLLDEMNTRFMHGTMSPEMRSTILTAVTAISSTPANAKARAQAAVYLTVTSSQYQVQR
ncbi:MAG: DUF1800 family protein [Pyrinomonadaceae bacterium]